MTQPAPPGGDGRPPAGPPASGAPPPPRPDEAHADALAERLGRKLSAVIGDELRARAAAEELSALPGAEAVLVVGRLLRLARDHHAAAEAVAAVARALARGLVDADFVADCLGLARSRADRLAEALFAAGPAIREYSADDEEFVDRRLRALTLGERRALSRRRDADWLARLAHDQDPRVIRELLRNPRVTEREALLAAARRPTGAKVLEEVLASRFGTSARVRRAVAQNPYAPVALAVRALASLPSPALRLVAGDGRVAAAVRAHAASLLVARRSTPAERDQESGVAPLPPDEEAELDALLRSLQESTAGTLADAGPAPADGSHLPEMPEDFAEPTGDDEPDQER